MRMPSIAPTRTRHQRSATFPADVRAYLLLPLPRANHQRHRPPRHPRVLLLPPVLVHTLLRLLHRLPTVPRGASSFSPRPPPPRHIRTLSHLSPPRHIRTLSHLSQRWHIRTLSHLSQRWHIRTLSHLSQRWHIRTLSHLSQRWQSCHSSSQVNDGMGQRMGKVAHQHTCCGGGTQRSMFSVIFPFISFWNRFMTFFIHITPLLILLLSVLVDDLQRHRLSRSPALRRRHRDLPGETPKPLSALAAQCCQRRPNVFPVN
jgi:hypothetical protein